MLIHLICNAYGMTWNHFIFIWSYYYIIEGNDNNLDDILDEDKSEEDRKRDENDEVTMTQGHV